MSRLTAMLALAAALSACAASDKDTSAREWSRAECNRVIDREARERCLKRVDETYGGRARDASREPPPRR
jgi:hypothetical protein